MLQEWFKIFYSEHRMIQISSRRVPAIRDYEQNFSVNAAISVDKRYRLYNSNILNTEFYVPSDKEQQKIGNFFRQQDEVINAAHEQIKKLSIIKQALLQKMFAA